MAAPQPQQPDKVAEVKANAAAANSVPELRAEVIRLAEAVERLEAKVQRLERRRR